MSDNSESTIAETITECKFGRCKSIPGVGLLHCHEYPKCRGNENYEKEEDIDYEAIYREKLIMIHKIANVHKIHQPRPAEFLREDMQKIWDLSKINRKSERTEERCPYCPENYVLYFEDTNEYYCDVCDKVIALEELPFE